MQASGSRHKGTRWKRAEPGRLGASARDECSNQDSAISKDESSCREDERGRTAGRCSMAIRERKIKGSEMVPDASYHASEWREMARERGKDF
jgi:hypothetical protein